MLDIVAITETLEQGTSLVTEESITLGFVIAGALADSINPCVFGVLIFLLAFMTKMFKTRRQMISGGLFYTFVVYITYLAIGFGLLKVAVDYQIANAFYWIGASIAIIAGLLEIKDFFWYGKGFSLQIMPSSAKRIKVYTSKIQKFYKKAPRLGFLTIGLLGIFVVLVELPCTGAPYFAVLSLLSKGEYAEAVPLLLLYNFIFILPLFVIIWLAYVGKGKSMEKWRKKHRGFMRLATGLFLLALGGYMVYSVVTAG